MGWFSELIGGRGADQNPNRGPLRRTRSATSNRGPASGGEPGRGEVADHPNTSPILDEALLSMRREWPSPRALTEIERGMMERYLQRSLAAVDEHTLRAAQQGASMKGLCGISALDPLFSSLLYPQDR